MSSETPPLSPRLSKLFHADLLPEIQTKKEIVKDSSLVSPLSTYFHAGKDLDRTLVSI